MKPLSLLPAVSAVVLALATAAATAQTPPPEPPAAAPLPSVPSPAAATTPPPPPPAAGTKKPAASEAKAGATDLLAAMERTALAAGRAMQAERAKEPALRSRKTRAFKKNLAVAAKFLAQLRVETSRKDAAAARTARNLDKAMGALDTAFKFSGVRVPEVTEAIGRLQATWALYEKAFGRSLLVAGDPDAADRPLVEKEQTARLGAFKRQAGELVTRLRSLRAALRKYRGVEIELAWLAAEAEMLTRTPATFGAFLTALHRAQWIEGKFQGLNDYVDLVYPAAAKEFDALDTFWMASDKETAAAHAELFAGYDPAAAAAAKVTWRATERSVTLSEADAAAGAAYLESGWEAETDEGLTEAEAMKQDASFEEEESSDDLDDAGDLDETEDDEDEGDGD